VSLQKILGPKNLSVVTYTKASITKNSTPITLNKLQWKIINCKQSARWQHISWLKASAFCSWQKKLWLLKDAGAYTRTGATIWWLAEPDLNDETWAEFSTLDVAACMPQTNAAMKQHGPTISIERGSDNSKLGRLDTQKSSAVRKHLV
jgi:hypothetical protein